MDTARSRCWGCKRDRGRDGGNEEKDGGEVRLEIEAIVQKIINELWGLENQEEVFCSLISSGLVWQWRIIAVEDLFCFALLYKPGHENIRNGYAYLIFWCFGCFLLIYVFTFCYTSVSCFCLYVTPKKPKNRWVNFLLLRSDSPFGALSTFF